MAKIVGAVNVTHVPYIGRAIAQGLQQEPYWKPFFDGFPPVHDWLEKVRPDVAVVIYNDHGLNFFLDKMPTFAVGAAQEYRNADEGWGIPVLPPFRGEPDLSWHLIESLLAEEFDLVTCQEMLVDPSPFRWSCSGRSAIRARCAPCRCASIPCSIRCPRRRAASSSAVPSAAPSSRGRRTPASW